MGRKTIIAMYRLFYSIDRESCDLDHTIKSLVETRAPNHPALAKAGSRATGDPPWARAWTRVGSLNSNLTDYQLTLL